MDHAASLTGSKLSKRLGSKGTAGEGVEAIFQTLAPWEKSPPYSRALSFIGILLECCQWLALVVNTAFRYDEPVVKEFVFAVTATIIPFWDRSFGSMELSMYFIPMCIYVVFVFIAGGILVGFVTKRIEQTSQWVSLLDRGMLEVVAGWGFFPLMHAFMGGTACDGDFVANFPTESCYSGTHIGIIIIGVFGLVITFAEGGLISVTLSDVSPQSTHYRARPHNYVEGIMFLSKVILVILFHVTVPHGAHAVFNIFVMIFCAMLLIVHAYVLPFYNHWMTSTRCVVFASMFTAALINTLSALTGDWFAKYRFNCFLLAALLPFGALLGYQVSYMRPSITLREKLHVLLHESVVPKHEAQFPFPRGLMKHDLKLVPLRFRTLEQDLIYENEDELAGLDTAGPKTPEEWDRIVRSASEVLVPFVENVNIASDAEVATRFLHEHYKITLVSPTANYLAFASRIFIKAFLIYRKSGIVRFHFANFLFAFANRLNLSLELLEEIDAQAGTEHDAIIMYSSYKLGVKVRELFGLRDSTHMKSFQRAKHLHKEALTEMASFWSKLMESKGDIVGLAVLTNTLSTRRQKAQDEYERALTTQSGDRQLLSTYASFLEHVLCDETGAEEFRLMAEEAAEEKKNRIMHGSKAKKQSTKMSVIREEEDVDLDVTDASGDVSSQTLMVMLMLFLGLVGLCSIGMFITQVSVGADGKSHTEAVAGIGSVRSSSQEVVYLSIFANEEKNKCIDQVCEAKPFTNALQKLSEAEVALRAMHNKITWGDRAVGWTTKPLQNMIRRNVMMKLTPDDGTGFSGQLQTTARTVPTSEKYSSLRDESNSLSSLQSPWTLIHVLSVHTADFINKALVNGAFGHGLEFVSGQTSKRTFNMALKAIVSAQLESVSDASVQALGIISGLFVATILLLVVTYLTFYANLQNVAVTKVMTLKLFTLIPYPTQEMLFNSTKSKLDVFERSNNEDSDIDEHDASLLVAEEQKSHEEDDDEDEDRTADYHSRSASPRKENLRKSLVHLAKGVSTNFDDESHRKMSRFFGAARPTGQVRPILKATTIGSGPAGPAKVVKKKHTKHVQFRIEGEDEAHHRRIFKEPTVRIVGTSKKEIVSDLEKSIKQVEDEQRKDVENEQKRKEQEAEKMISGGMKKRSVRPARKADSEEDSGVFDRANSYKSLFVMCFQGFVAVVLITVLIITTTISSHTANGRDAALAHREFGTVLGRYTAFINQQMTASTAFVHFGYQNFYHRFFDPILLERKNLILEDMIADESMDSSSRLAFAALTRQGSGILDRCIALMSVAALAHAKDGLLQMKDVPALATSTWPLMGEHAVNASLSDLWEDPHVLPSSEMIYNSNTTAAELHTLALHGLASDFVWDQWDDLVLTHYYALEHSAAKSQEAMKAEYEEENTAIVIILALSAVGFVSCCYLLYRYSFAMKAVGFKASPLLLRAELGFTALGIVILLALLGIVGKSMTDSTNYYIPASHHEHVFRELNSTTVSLTSLHLKYAGRYVVDAEPLSLFHIGRAQAHLATSLEHLIEEVYDTHDPEEIIAEIDKFALVNLLPSHGLEVAKYLRYASTLTPGNRKTSSIPSPPFIRSYDASDEASFDADTVRYADDFPALHYTTNVKDLAKDNETLIGMARHTIFGLRGLNHYMATEDALVGPVSEAISRMMVRGLDDVSEKLELRTRGLLACSVMATVFMGSVAIMPFVRFVLGSTQTGPTTTGMMDTLYKSTLRRCQIALALILVLVAVQFALMIITADMGHESAVIVDMGHARDFYVCKSLTLSLLGEANLAENNHMALEQTQTDVREIVIELKNARNTLYFDETATSSAFGHVRSLTPRQREVSFGGPEPLERLYLRWIDVLEGLAALPPKIVASGDMYVLEPSFVTEYTSRVATLRNMVDGLRAKLKQSNDILESDVTSALDATLIPDTIILVVIVVAIIGELKLIFIPVSYQLNHEAVGTKLMLNMIPAVVRDLVPKISTYLETGLLIEEDDEAVIYQKCPIAKEFLEQWQAGVPVSEAYDIMNRSPYGLILINAAGIVQHATPYTTSLLGYTDLPSRNISCLVEEPLRSLHDGFLKRFVTQGTSRIIGGGRDVVGLNKDGERVHMFLFLYEANRDTGETFFLGQLERYVMDDVRTGRKVKRKADGHEASPQGSPLLGSPRKM